MNKDRRLSKVDKLVRAELRAAVRRAKREAENPKPRSGRNLPCVSLKEYVETTRKLVLDPWQVDICKRLEKAFWLSRFDMFVDDCVWFNLNTGPKFVVTPSGMTIYLSEVEKFKNKGTRACIAAPPQFGKSIIVSQAYPSWILGYDPLHSFRLATYNINHSKRFSGAIRRTMQSAEHRKFFPDEKGFVDKRMGALEWTTAARIEANDGQPSFIALGLQTGFVGLGVDTLLMDDPYSSAEDALSEIIRDKSWRFYSDTANPRTKEHTNVFIMFHRYHQDDQGGRAIATGEFQLWRYAAEADGDYEDEESGLRYADPIGRAPGEFLSARFPESYYIRQKKNEQVWYSQFQGRPSAKSGKTFNVNKLRTINGIDVPEILFTVRAWDNAATEGAGAFTAGVLMGITAAEGIYIFDVARDQVDTAQRRMLQGVTAVKDGLMVAIHAPQDPGSAGKDVAFDFVQELTRKKYVAICSPVSGNKEMRANPLSKAVNSDQVFLVLNGDGSTPEWHKTYKSELRYFPASTFKDQVDASSDGYSYLKKLFYRGLVIKGASTTNLLHWSLFEARFGLKIPQHWEVGVGLHISPDSSRPSGYLIAARAAENAHLGERIFVPAAQRMFVNDPTEVLAALVRDLKHYCAGGERQPSVFWLNKGAGSVLQVAAQKLSINLTEFQDDETAGIPETNYYVQKLSNDDVFYKRKGSTHCYFLVDDDQYEQKDVVDEAGLLSMRQELSSWSYNDKGKPQPYGGVTLNCMRMVLYKFALSATSLSVEERRMALLSPELQPEAVRAKLGTPAFVEAHFAQQHALAEIRAREEEDKRRGRFNGTVSYTGARPVQRRFRSMVR